MCIGAEDIHSCGLIDKTADEWEDLEEEIKSWGRFQNRQQKT